MNQKSENNKNERKESQEDDLDIKYLVFDIFGQVDQYKLTNRANSENKEYFLKNITDVEILHNCVHILMENCKNMDTEGWEAYKKKIIS